MSLLRLPHLLAGCCLAVAAAHACAQTASPSRGQVLYELHCIGCHSAQMHWRAKRAVTDWPSLKAQVRLWQSQAQLNWSDDDIDAVARHLNATVYHLQQPPLPVGRTRPPAPGA